MKIGQIITFSLFFKSRIGAGWMGGGGHPQRLLQIPLSLIFLPHSCSLVESIQLTATQSPNNTPPIQTFSHSSRPFSFLLAFLPHPPPTYYSLHHAGSGKASGQSRGQYLCGCRRRGSQSCQSRCEGEGSGILLCPVHHPNIPSSRGSLTPLPCYSLGPIGLGSPSR